MAEFVCVVFPVIIYSTVFEDQLKKHLKKCNQTKKTQVVSLKMDV